MRPLRDRSESEVCSWPCRRALAWSSALRAVAGGAAGVPTSARVCVRHALCLSPPHPENLLAPRLQRCPSPGSLGRPWETWRVWAPTLLSEEMLRGWKADTAANVFLKAVGEEGAGK